MKVISIISNKGGVGKSTLAFELANYLLEQGKKVYCVDLDVRQRAFYHLMKSMHYPFISKELDIKATKGDFDYVVIDTSPEYSDRRKLGHLKATDYYIVPYKPAKGNFQTNMDLFEMLPKNKDNVIFVPNMFPTTRSNITKFCGEQFEEAADQNGFKVTNKLKNRTAILEAEYHELPVLRYSQKNNKSKAYTEFSGAMESIYETIH